MLKSCQITPTPLSASRGQPCCLPTDQATGGMLSGGVPYRRSSARRPGRGGPGTGGRGPRAPRAPPPGPAPWRRGAGQCVERLPARQTCMFLFEGRLTGAGLRSHFWHVSHEGPPPNPPPPAMCLVVAPDPRCWQPRLISDILTLYWGRTAAQSTPTLITISSGT